MKRLIIEKMILSIEEEEKGEIHISFLIQRLCIEYKLCQ